MERNTLGHVKFDEDARKHITHDKVREKAKELYHELQNKGYSVSDIAHIGLRMTTIANDYGY